MERRERPEVVARVVVLVERAGGDETRLPLALLVPAAGRAAGTGLVGGATMAAGATAGIAVAAAAPVALAG